MLREDKQNNQPPRTTREVLQAAGRTRPLSDTLRCKIIPGVTLDEGRAILSRAAGPSLSDLIHEQRGAKPWPGATALRGTGRPATLLGSLLSEM